MLQPRKHQLECIRAIDTYFEAENSRGLIKMFCGAGKSLVIYNTLIKHGGSLSVVVVPSISLITQFNNDYLLKYAEYAESEYIQLTICSDNEIGKDITDFTTSPESILEFLENEDNKIILVTYQSQKTLFDVIEAAEMTIDLICFDEAHHVTADGYQDHIFGPVMDVAEDAAETEDRYGFIDSNVEKALFFTATPINKNNICMFDYDNHMSDGTTDYELLDILDTNSCIAEEPHCGDMIYEYKHLDGIRLVTDDGDEPYTVLNDYKICVDLYTSNTDTSIFEAISRTILETGNSRVLTFHSRSETASEKGSDVISFFSEANKRLFKKTFNKIRQTEFPDKISCYQNIKLTGITGNTKNRNKILADFDNTADTDIYILGSCATIGEGIDTKSANMCVFVDPKQSYVQIIQNIGRVCRKQPNISTILIPAYVDVEKYKDCVGDPVARDRVIREEMSRTGDFNGILNCLSALRQEDPYMFELCLKYPDVFTKKELRDNFKNNGLELEDTEYTGVELFETLKVPYNPKVSESANFNMLSHKLKSNIQVSQQKILEEDIYIDKGFEKTTYFVKMENGTFMKTASSTSGCSKKRIEKPHRNAKPFVHTNSDIQVLWGFTSDIESTKGVFGGYIEATVVIDNAEQWLLKLEEVKTYIDTYNKRPNKRDKDQNIGKMCFWIGNQLQNYKQNKNIMKIPEIKQAWENFTSDPKYSQYFTSNEQEWYNKFEAVKTYIDTYNKRPNRTNKDQYINTMSHWIEHQITSYNQNKGIMLYINIKGAWTNFISDTKYKQYFISNEEEWYNTLISVKTYMNTYNKRPSLTDKNQHVKSLSRWICTQVTNYKQNKNIMKIPEIKQAWLKFTNDCRYKKYFTSNKEEWFSNLSDVKTFIDMYNKLPNTSWINNQLHNYKQNKCIMKIYEIRQAWLNFTTDLKYAQYFISNEEEWYNTLDKVKTYINTYNKRPNREDKDQNIKKMGSWISTQLQNYKQNKQIMKISEIRQAWLKLTTDPKYVQYFISNNDEWYNTLVEVKTYIDTYNKRPNRTNKDQYINTMSHWISRQITNYKQKTQIMKESEIRQTWETFTNDPKYASYFATEPKESKPAPKSTTIKPKIKTIEEPKESTIIRKVSEYQELTKKMSTQKSDTTNKMFTQNSSLWHNYHDSRDFSFKGYDKQEEIPLNKIITYLETKKNNKLNILDLGCGRNLIQKHFTDNKKFKITGYDYVAHNGSKVADISKLPDEDESAQICVYSQSLMGSNWKEYLAEGHRVLGYRGEMIISESVERYHIVKAELEALGMYVLDNTEYSETQRWFYIYVMKQ